MGSAARTVLGLALLAAAVIVGVKLASALASFDLAGFLAGLAGKAGSKTERNAKKSEDREKRDKRERENGGSSGGATRGGSTRGASGGAIRGDDNGDGIVDDREYDGGRYDDGTVGIDEWFWGLFGRKVA